MCIFFGRVKASIWNMDATKSFSIMSYGAFGPFHEGDPHLTEMACSQAKRVVTGLLALGVLVAFTYYMLFQDMEYCSLCFRQMWVV